MDAGAHRSRVFATNVTGAFLCAREAVRRMSTRYGGAGGAIVNVSSGASQLGSPHEYIDYAATKGALDTMTIGLSREVAAEGIRVNAVRAGHVYTDDARQRRRAGPRRAREVAGAHGPRRRARGDRACRSCGCLSDEASYTTGAFLDVAGREMSSVDATADGVVDTPRLRLRPVHEGDAEATARLMTPALSRWLASWPSPITAAAVAARIASLRQAIAAGRTLCFAIERREDGAMIGLGVGDAVASTTRLAATWGAGSASRSSGTAT